MSQPHLRLTTLEAGRAIAAILVVFHHAGNNIAEPRFYGRTILGGYLEHLHVGVDFFFVLSGFIIAWVHWPDIGRPERLGRYALRRFLRIYPPYWGILIPLTIAYFLVSAAGKPHQRDLGNVFFSLTLLPYPMPPIIGVAWTLVHEMLFYAVFGLIIAVGRKAIWLLPASGLAILVAQAAAPLPFPASILLSAYNLEFLFGIAAALALRSRTVPWPGAVAAAGMLAFVAFVALAPALPDVSLVYRLAFGLSSTLIVLGIVELERQGRASVPPSVTFLGGASYAIYLIHGIALIATMHVLFRALPRSVPAELVLLLLVAAGIIAGSLYYRFVETPLTAFLRARLVDRAETPRRPDATGDGPRLGTPTPKLP